MKRLALMAMGLIAAVSSRADAFPVDWAVSSSSFGVAESVHQLDFTSTGALNRIVLDFSDLSEMNAAKINPDTGDLEAISSNGGVGFGLDLSNVTPGDVEVSGTTVLSTITIDNVAKTVTINFSSVIALGTNLSITVNRVQNPNCPGVGTVVVETLDTGGLFDDEGRENFTFLGGRTDTDGDFLPDGFELYYRDLAGFTPGAPDDPFADTDGDEWTNLQEFYACTHPGDPDSLPTIAAGHLDDFDEDGIYDFEERYPGECVDTDEFDEPGHGVIADAECLDTDGDATPDYKDLDSDADGFLDELERGYGGQPGTHDPDGSADPGTAPTPPDPSPRLRDTDNDGRPDFQEPDADGDGANDDVDTCYFIPNPGQEDLDEDGVGDVCDPDIDGDEDLNVDDNCVFDPNPDQEDQDEDGVGDACDDDIDGDDELNDDDNCVTTANPGQEDADDDGIGDACDEDEGNFDCSDAPDPAECEEQNGLDFRGGGGCSVGRDGAGGGLLATLLIGLLALRRRRRE